VTRSTSSRWASWLALGLFLGLSLSAAPARAVQIVVTYGDGAGEGFNDPVLGAARRAAFQFAANIWAGTLAGSVTVRVDATMDPLGGGPSSAVLGQAGAELVARDFAGAAVSGTWYPIGLANQLAGSDLDAGTADIGATFNSDVDNGTVLGSTDWYYGTDANPGSDIDFVAVVLHELGHGLGFFDMVNQTTGEWFGGFPDIYGRNLVQPGAGQFTSLSDGQRLLAITSDNVFWNGANVVADTGGTVAIYAPSPYEGGSSISHWDTSLNPDELMEPIYTGPNHDAGLAIAALEDLGWGLGGTPGTTVTTTTITTSTTTTTLPPIDPFLCYKTKPTKNGAKFSREEVTLLDDFGGTTTNVIKPKGLCNPAALNGRAALDADTDLASYAIKETPKHTRRKTIQVTNEFGEIVVDTIRPERLLVPSAKSLERSPAAPDPATHNLDHFKCYRIKLVKGSPTPHKGLQVTVGDPFTDPKTFNVKKPRHLCNPVSKNGEGLKQPGGHLLCYKVKRSKGQPRHVRQKGVYVTDGFSGIQLDTKNEELLCVPSLKKVF
jgi:hypothetical protein